MAKLSDLLSSREIMANSDNLEKGRIYTVTPAHFYACLRSDYLWCWQSPGCGTATIEIWGAAGGGARMCCCGFGLPGNAPGYAKKTIAVFPCTVIEGCPGMACQAHSLCHSGCGLPTYVTFSMGRDLCGFENGCMCASGGRGGTAICSTGTSAYCCYTYCTFCTTLFENGCGIVCNVCPGMHCGQGYGGDVNCCGIYSMVVFCRCQPLCSCQQIQYVPHAANVFSEDGGYLVFVGGENDNQFSMWSGAGLHQAAYVVNNHGKSPTGGIPWTVCYNGAQACGCYETLGCMQVMPYGVAGVGPFPCPDVRDHGKRGGHGAIRITYRGSGYNDHQCARIGGAL